MPTHGRKSGSKAAAGFVSIPLQRSRRNVSNRDSVQRLGEDEPVPGRLLSSSPMLNQLRLLWDSANAFWNDQVVEFGESAATVVTATTEHRRAGWETLGIAMALGLGGFFLALTRIPWLAFSPEATRSARAGLRTTVPQAGASRHRTYASRGSARLPDSCSRPRPELAPQLTELRALYLNLRYGPAPLAAQLSRLKFLVNQLRA